MVRVTDLQALAGATETAIIVPVPAAEAVVGPHRAALDHSAAWGVPAHVTVLYPFLTPTFRDVAAKLPVDAWIDRVRLIAGTDAPGSWRAVAEFVLPS